MTDERPSAELPSAADRQADWRELPTPLVRVVLTFRECCEDPAMPDGEDRAGGILGAATLATRWIALYAQHVCTDSDCAKAKRIILREARERIDAALPLPRACSSRVPRRKAR